jgi:hypothetical protein
MFDPEAVFWIGGSQGLSRYGLSLQYFSGTGEGKFVDTELRGLLRFDVVTYIQPSTRLGQWIRRGRKPAALRFSQRSGVAVRISRGGVFRTFIVVDLLTGTNSLSEGYCIA